MVKVENQCVVDCHKFCLIWLFELDWIVYLDQIGFCLVIWIRFDLFERDEI